MLRVGIGPLFLFLILISTFSCSKKSSEEAIFLPLESEKSGIDFTNSLDYTEQLNPYTFKNFYNGGGVGIGDLNNDGLSDIFFAGNMVSNRLYLNKGDLKFIDITIESGLESKNVWSTGVSMVDINADGWLDIYVCKSGPPGGDKRYNELFINNGDLTFTEHSKDYGLDITGLSVHSTFFDYDKDGDLDCYLLNNSITSIGAFEMVENQRLIPDSSGGNKLLRNDDGHFTDVTSLAGIYSSAIGFGLGAMAGDINNDNWPDLYISNDFFEKDYLYINQKDGTFKDLLEIYIREISMGSMGADLADLNNDGNPEYFVTEMLPERHDRMVTKAFFDSWEGHQSAMNKGFYNQFGRNVLQLNNGDGTFSEIGRYAGVEATDWSWACLIFDMDNDGLNDIYVSNGIYKDLLDLDYLNIMADRSRIQRMIKSDVNAIKSMIDMMPSEPMPNYAYRNNGDMTFTNKASDWGFETPTFSNGSAYGDLDNDGDLDLVVNNINMVSAIYENRTNQIFKGRNYLSLKLNGSGNNTNAIGAKISLFKDREIFYREVNPMRGFQSTVDQKLLFGLGDIDHIDSLEIIWPNSTRTLVKDPLLNQILEYDEADSRAPKKDNAQLKKPVFSPYSNSTIAFTHEENNYNDFNKDRLLFHMNSTEGPCICKGDINNDGLDDFYVGGSAEQAGSLFIQDSAEKFSKIDSLFKKDSQSEDTDCSIFDANGDGFMDLYVTSGGSEFSSFSVWLNDRLYFGDGKGGFTKTSQRLPSKGFESTSVVVPFDYDQDGDQDLFIGGRSVPFFYGISADSYLLQNDGRGNYSMAADEARTLLKNLGMVTDAVTADLDGDGSEELIIVGRWMPVKIFKFDRGKTLDVSSKWGMNKTNGWYNTIVAKDLNNDQKIDLVVGNHGLNTRFSASEDEPIELLVNDFDNNGTFEQILAMYSDGKKYPYAQLEDLGTQMPALAQKYSSFNSYKNDELDQVIPKEVQKRGQVHPAYNLATGLFINNGKKLVFSKLPMHAQLSPVYAIISEDFDHDGNMDIVLGGNFSQSKPEAGSYQASYGALFLGRGDGEFRFAPSSTSGIKVDGDIRDVVEINSGNNKIVLFTRNNREIFTIKNE